MSIIQRHNQMFQAALNKCFNTKLKMKEEHLSKFFRTIISNIGVNFTVENDSLIGNGYY